MVGVCVGSARTPGAPAARRARKRVGAALSIAALTVASVTAATGAGAESTSAGRTLHDSGSASAGVTGAGTSVSYPVTYPYACTTTMVGGATFTADPVNVTITDALGSPGVHTYPGGPVRTQVRLSADAGSSAVSALLATGTTDWTSDDARLVWGGVTSPPTAFTWHLFPVPQFSERFPITFTTSAFQLPGPGDVSPGALSWDFQANPGVQPGFERGHVECQPAQPVQVYATYLPAGGPACLHQGRQWTCRFSYTGAVQMWEVPPDVRSITTEVRGANGGTNPDRNIDIDKVWPGGRGGLSVASLAVRPGEQLMVTVGAVNGFNGGAPSLFDGDVSGGGASDVREAPYGLANRLVVAGGGGAGGWSTFCFTGCTDNTGGAGGGAAGGNAGGGGGSQTAGGAVQPGGVESVPAEPGSLGGGGTGAAGGGGGYFGGGGSAFLPSAEVGGGGGGSGFVPPGTASSTVAGRNSGDGSISISYTSSTTPYTSRYSADEVRWLDNVQRSLRSRDQSDAQHDAAMLMVLFVHVAKATGHGVPDLGSHPGTGPITVTSTYRPGENAGLVYAAGLLHSDPPTVQRTAVALLGGLLAGAR